MSGFIGRPLALSPAPREPEVRRSMGAGSHNGRPSRSQAARLVGGTARLDPLHFRVQSQVLAQLRAEGDPIQEDATSARLLSCLEVRRKLVPQFGELA